MKNDPRSHRLFHASQAEVAEFMGVDRGTIRNWTKAGMPYVNNGQGKPAEYDASIALYWWASMIQRNNIDLPDMSPCRRLAVARVFSDRDCDTRERKQSRAEFPECFRKMVSAYFSKAEIEDAISYANAVFDVTFLAM